MFKNRATRFALTAASIVLACAVPAVGQQPSASNPHEGQWSLEFNVSTPPGGVSRVASRGITPEAVQTVNLLAHISRASLTVAADGTVHWEQRGGRMHWDNFSTLSGRTALSDVQVVLRVAGKATATPAPPGSGRTYDRRLALELSWTGGSGSAIDHGGKPATIALSADGNQVMTTYGTAAAVYEQSAWQLEPAAVLREEISPDLIRETTLFRASRQTEGKSYTFGISQAPTPIIERIEIKHIHYPRLVPRG